MCFSSIDAFLHLNHCIFLCLSFRAFTKTPRHMMLEKGGQPDVIQLPRPDLDENLQQAVSS